MADSAELDFIKIGLEVLSLVSTGFIGYVGLRIRTLVVQSKLDLANNKAELLKHQQEIKDTLQADSQNLSQKVLTIDLSLASHTVQDTERFASMGKTLDRQDVILSSIDRKLDRLGDKDKNTRSNHGSDSSK
jgi:hypothetical protein